MGMIDWLEYLESLNEGDFAASTHGEDAWIYQLVVRNGEKRIELLTEPRELADALQTTCAYNAVPPRDLTWAWEEVMFAISPEEVRTVRVALELMSVDERSSTGRLFHALRAVIGDREPVAVSRWP